MEPSRVWYTDMRAKPGLSMISKLENLVESAGIRSLDWKKRFTALKIHFGEPGNLAFIRPPIRRILNEKIAEYSLAVLKGKVHFHLSFVMQVTPDCDCWGYNDTPVVPDIGIFASLDPVSLDQACADAVKAAAGLSGSVLPEHGRHAGEDKFRHLHPDTDWKAGLAYAERIGLGSRSYLLSGV